MINICWLTSRRFSGSEWFCWTLQRETGGNYEGLRVIGVDFWNQPMKNWTMTEVWARHSFFEAHNRCPDFIHVPPKPTVWQGPHRLTQNDYFCPSNARNTGL